MGKEAAGPQMKYCTWVSLEGPKKTRMKILSIFYLRVDDLNLALTRALVLGRLLLI
jgi:hypothetical protein